MKLAPSADLSVPDEISDLLSRYIATEYAYTTPKGAPLCWPVTPYWYPKRQVLAIATGLAYPTKADHPKVNPKIAMLFSDPKGTGLADPPTVLAQGTATVLDEDLQYNADRYVVELREKFPAARLAINRLTVSMLDFYLPRLWVEMTPVRMIIDATDGSRVVHGTALDMTEQGPVAAVDDHAPLRDDHWKALVKVASSHDDAVLTTVGADGFPYPRRTNVMVRNDRSLELDAVAQPSEACLTFHAHTLAGTRFKAYLVRGNLLSDGGRVIFKPWRLVGFFGNGAVWPLSAIPEVKTLRKRLKKELLRRGQPMPKLRVPAVMPVLPTE
ncbi:MAG: hypothetical protein ABR507_10795 [Actinomycetota bacterium]|nr:hypothetical protein [Actinomycetota bacterium]